jgi:hypothetical protein
VIGRTGYPRNTVVHVRPAISDIRHHSSDKSFFDLAQKYFWHVLRRTTRILSLIIVSLWLGALHTIAFLLEFRAADEIGLGNCERANDSLECTFRIVHWVCLDVDPDRRAVFASQLEAKGIGIPVYHIRGWRKFNRHYGDFCTGADTL